MKKVRQTQIKGPSTKHRARLFKSFKAVKGRETEKLSHTEETVKDLTTNPVWPPILNPAWNGGKDNSGKTGN